MAGADLAAPALSVVMPVRDGVEHLRHSLPALVRSDLPRSAWELIVVDDGSRDGSAEVAAEVADRVIRLPLGGSPPRARNHGAAAARGDVLVFLDADVCVDPDALRRIHQAFEEPGLGAVFGAYDLSPTAPDLVSQYRNLLHAYVHRRGSGEAVTFWTGLGGVRRAAFEGVGRLDESERLDDVELGYRLVAAGYRIRLDPAIQGTHRKRWTLGNMMMTDVRDRGVPWMRLLLAGRHPRSDLNIGKQDRLITALVGLALVAGVGAAVTGEAIWALCAGVALAGSLIADGDFLLWLARQRGWWFVVRALPLRLLYYVLNIVSVGIALLPVRWRRAALPTESNLVEETGA